MYRYPEYENGNKKYVQQFNVIPLYELMFPFRRFYQEKLVRTITHHRAQQLDHIPYENFEQRKDAEFQIKVNVYGIGDPETLMAYIVRPSITERTKNVVVLQIMKPPYTYLQMTGEPGKSNLNYGITGFAVPTKETARAEVQAIFDAWETFAQTHLQKEPEELAAMLTMHDRQQFMMNYGDQETIPPATSYDALLPTLG